MSNEVNPGGKKEPEVVMNLLVLPISLPVAVVVDIVEAIGSMFGPENLESEVDADRGHYTIKVFAGKWPFGGK